MRTFSITTLGCRVNHYEGEQLAALCRAAGLRPAPHDQADLRIVHTCSVTVQAASKSGQTVRRSTRLPILNAHPDDDQPPGRRNRETNPVAAVQAAAAAAVKLSEPEASSVSREQQSHDPTTPTFSRDPKGSATDRKVPTRPARPRVVVTGCWATSNPTAAAAIPGVDAVLGHHQNVGDQLAKLLAQWQADPQPPQNDVQATQPHARSGKPEPVVDEKWMTQQAGIPAVLTTNANQPHPPNPVKRKLDAHENPCEPLHEAARQSDPRRGMTTLPQLDSRQPAHQRAFLKVQDGCDAHCTYCIIPQLRPRLWSKPLDQAVDEARRLTDAGHAEIVLTGIFLGAYAQPTALRRRQTTGAGLTLGRLIEALCTRVPNLRRLRLSSMEPGDLTPDLLAVLRSHPQVLPHFHLPLQSGSDAILRRMNRQYTRSDFLGMVEHVNAAFDRPAITTDIIVGFPGESDAEFAQTLDVVDRARFIHTHAFSYSPRPNTAAARWTKHFVRGPVVNHRINTLRALAADHSEAFRRQFIGEVAEVLVEGTAPNPTHGRSERYFPVHFTANLPPGTSAKVRITRVTPTQTLGDLLEPRP